MTVELVGRQAARERVGDLSTAADDTPAVRLHAARGWRRIGLLAPDVQVMGRKL